MPKPPPLQTYRQQVQATRFAVVNRTYKIPAWKIHKRRRTLDCYCCEKQLDRIHYSREQWEQDKYSICINCEKEYGMAQTDWQRAIVDGTK